MRLIDADALIQKRNHAKAYAKDMYVIGQGYVMDAPTISAVPVVRCGECRWFADNNGGNWFGCQMFNAIRLVPEDAPKENDYCSYGERVEDKP